MAAIERPAAYRPAMTLHSRARRLAAAVGVAAAVSLSLSVAPAQAANFPPEFEAAQVGLTYTVYAPANPQGLGLARFELIQCGPKQFGQDEQIVATYGKVTGNNIQIFESYHACDDGPWPVQLVQRFKIGGATAHLFAGCNTPRSCERTTRGDVKTHGGYLRVTLPGVPETKNNPGLDATFIEMYSEGFSAKKVRKFAKSMQIPS
jgi:hypothetical protein